jgi:hypothetical protein
MASEMYRECRDLFYEMIRILKSPNLGECGLDTAMDIIHEIEMRLRAHPSCHGRHKLQLAKAKKRIELKIKRHEEMRRLRLENARLRLEMKLKLNQERRQRHRVPQDIKDQFKLLCAPQATSKQFEAGDEHYPGLKRKRGAGFVKDSEAQTAGGHRTKKPREDTPIIKTECEEDEGTAATIKEEDENDEVITPTIKEEYAEESDPITARDVYHCTTCRSRWKRPRGKVELFCPWCKNEPVVTVSTGQHALNALPIAITNIHQFESKKDQVKSYKDPRKPAFIPRPEKPEPGDLKRSEPLAGSREAKLKHGDSKTPGTKKDTTSAINAFRSKFESEKTGLGLPPGRTHHNQASPRK